MSQVMLTEAQRRARLGRRLRLLSAVGIASVAAGVLVEAFPDALGTRIPAAMLGDQVMTLPVVWVPLATLLAVVAWTYLLVGALHAPLALRLVVAGGWAVLALPLVKAAPLWSGPGYLVVLVLLFWRRWARPLLDFGILEALIFGAAILATFMGTLVASVLGSADRVQLYVLSLSGQFVTFAVMVLPLLILAGMDLAEMASKAGGWAAGRVQAWGGRRLAWLLLGLSALQAGYFVLDGIPRTPGFWLTVAAVGALLALGRRLPTGGFLAEPPLPLLVSLLVVAAAAPIGGVLLVAFMPKGAETWVAVAGFMGAALLAALAAVLLRKWLDRRWPGAWLALLAVALWLAWMLAGGRLPAWGPVARGVEVAVALAAAGLAIVALRRPQVPGRLMLLALEALVVLTVIGGIEAAYRNSLDPGDIFATLQTIVMLGSAIWLGLAQRRWKLLGRIALALGTAGVALWLGLNPGVLGVAQTYVGLLLMAGSLIWGITVAHRRTGELLGEAMPPVHGTFLVIGFSLMTVAILGWNRALTPAPDAITDFGFLAAFGLVAIGLPVYLLSLVQRLWQPGGAEAQAVAEAAAAEDAWGDDE